MADRPIILVTRKLPKAVEEKLAESCSVRLNADDRLYTADELIEKSIGVDAILPCHSEHFTADVVARLPDSVKIVANFSVGYDHCDTDAFQARKIVVTNTPDVLSDATAETAMLCMLGAARRAGEGERMMRDGSWSWWSPAFMVGKGVTGKTLGIVGMGRVGRVFAKRAAAAFGMRVIYHNRSKLNAASENGAEFVAALPDLLAQADIVSLHCPNTPETRNLMNAETFALMKSGSILVNTARGAIVDEPALIHALQHGPLFAAGLDVYGTEPGGNPDIASLANTFLLPHIGSANEETRDAMGYRAIANLDAFFAGNPPLDRVA